MKRGQVLFFVLLLGVSVREASSCSGRFVNPLTDICWSCIFPLSIGPLTVNLGGREDTGNPGGLLCVCPRAGIPVPGIPVGFWEPVRLVDVTRVPYCMVNLGGISLGGGVKGYGTHTSHSYNKRSSKKSFYQMHWYMYPLIYWLELAMDFLCLEAGGFDIAYLTELDPLWNDDETAFLLNPEAILFGNVLAQGACAADCAAASLGMPLPALFWCGGCQGSLYPFTGSIDAHVGGVQASLLLAQRMIAKLHRELLLWGSMGREATCGYYPMPLLNKTQYKLQMTYPIPATTGPLACNPLGRTEVIHGAGKEFPIKGEDFGYLVWRKRHCCVF